MTSFENVSNCLAGYLTQEGDCEVRELQGVLQRGDLPLNVWIRVLKLAALQQVPVVQV